MQLTLGDSMSPVGSANCPRATFILPFNTLTQDD